jgi:hypothetical protein
MAGGGFGIYGSSGGGGGGITAVTIQNTAYVAKNGNDGTGVVDDLTKPFLTIAAASAAADAQDCVYVYRGSYTESSTETFVSNVYYYLEPNVEVINDTAALIKDNEGSAKNIYIFGYGNLTCLVQPIIVLSESASTIRLQCNNLTSANEILNFNGAKFEIDCHDISFQGKGITTSGSPTSDCYINFNTSTSSDSATTTWLIGHAAKTLTISGRYLSQNYARSGGVCFKTTMSSTARLIMEIDQFVCESGGTAINFDSTGAGVLVKNMIKKQGAGIIMGASPIVDFYNCQLKATGDIFEMTGAGTFNVFNSTFYQDVARLTDMTGSCVLNLVDCVIQQTNALAIIRITQTGEEGEETNPKLILQNVSMYKSDTGGAEPYSIQGTLVASNLIPIYVQGNVTATQNINTSALTNSIAGNAIVVDTDVQTSSNFIKAY